MYNGNCFDVDIVPVIALSDVFVSAVNDTSLFLEDSLNECNLDLARVGGDMDLDIGIVCRTNVGTESYLRVFDGYLITVGGCKIKVSRQ